MTLHLLRVSLLETDPLIWRRFLVHSDISLAELHDVIQVVMGWEDAHLHDFLIGGEHFGHLDDDGEMPFEVHDEARFALGDLSKEGDTFRYVYDFGDDWQHQMVVERVLARPTGITVKRAICLDGERACPPEDCGGPSGYEQLVQALGNEHHPEYREIRDWAGDWKVDRFEIDPVNRELSRARRR